MTTKLGLAIVPTLHKSPINFHVSTALLTHSVATVVIIHSSTVLHSVVSKVKISICRLQQWSRGLCWTMCQLWTGLFNLCGEHQWD